MAAIANLTIDQGATFSSDVTVKDAQDMLLTLQVIRLLLSWLKALLPLEHEQI